jgi:hypothetical protein
MISKNLAKDWKRNALFIIFFSLLFYFFLLKLAVADNSGVNKIPTNCILVGDYYECNATTNVTENSTFLVGVGEKTNCPYSCCINEVNYTDKNCTTGYQCKNNKCVSASDQNNPTVQTLTSGNDYTVFIIIGAGLVIIVLVIVAYLILKRSGARKPSKNFDELYRKYGKRKRARR